MGIFSFLSKKATKTRVASCQLAIESLEDRALMSCSMISGYVFHDLNNNGLREAGENPIANATIKLVDASNTVIATDVTDSAGFYSFDHDPTVSQAEATIEQTVVYPTTQTDYTLSKLVNKFDSSLGQLLAVEIYHNGTITSTIKVENTSASSPAAISATVSGTMKLTGPGFTSALDLSANAGTFNANNYDLILDFNGNSGFTFAPKSATGSKLTTLTGNDMAGFIGTGTVSLTEEAKATSFASGGGNLVASLTSNGTSEVKIVYRYIPNNCLKEGNYTIVLNDQPAGYVPGKLSSGGTVLNIPPGTNIIPVTLGDNDLVENDFAELVPAKLSGYVYVDNNDNGVKEAGENAIGLVSVTLSGTDDLQNNVSTTIQTDPAGFYEFIGLRPGTYTVTETQPPTYMDGIVTPGSQGGVAGTNVISAINLTSGKQSTNNNFGELLPGSLSGYVYYDANNNGVKDAGDSALSNVQIALNGVTSQGPIQVPAQTDANGFFQFTNLRPGTYSITETQPAGYQNGQNNIGSQGGQVTTNQFYSILLAMGIQGVNNNFGEVQPADMAIVKTANASVVQLGATVNYTLTVSNLGTGPAQNVSVTDTLPAGVTYVASTGAGWSITVSGNVITATRSGMQAGESSVITITVKAPLTPGNVTNVSTVTSTTPDPNPTNNKSTVTITIFNQPGQVLQQAIPPLVTKPPCISKAMLNPSWVTALDPKVVSLMTFIDGTYRTLFNRGATAGEATTWLRRLRNGTTRSQMVATLWTQKDHWSFEVKKIYQGILHRSATAGELSAGISKLQNGALLKDIRFTVLTSAEYLAQHSTADSFILGFYQDVLKQIPDSLTRLSLVQSMGTLTVADIASNLLNTAAAQNQVVIGSFIAVLRRMPTAAEVQQWSAKLQAGQVNEHALLKTLQSSGEFFRLARKSLKVR